MPEVQSRHFQLNRGQFLSAAWTDGNLWGETYQIDAWGNLNGIAAYASKPEMDNLSQMANNQNQFAGMNYDAAGDLLNDGLSSYTYNAAGEIVTAAGVTYGYDGAGRRLEKSSGKLYWYGATGDVLDESNASGTFTDEYVYFGGKRIARRDSSGNVDYYFADQLGTARVVTNSSGTILDDSDYCPFGRECYVVSETSGNTYKFTGKESDAETGNDYLEARFNSSTLGRFLSPDPLGGHQEDPQTLNKYVYVRNSPVSLTDPTGLDFSINSNLKCTGGNSATCQEGVQGTILKNGTFKPTQVVISSKDGNLVDQNGNKYTGTFDGKSVTFTDAGGTKSTGSWIQCSCATAGITGGGALSSSFSFTFLDHGDTQQLAWAWQFKGSIQQAESALTAAGFQNGPGIDLGDDEYRTPSEEHDSTHMLVDRNVSKAFSDAPVSTAPTTFGRRHTPEYYPWTYEGFINHVECDIAGAC